MVVTALSAARPSADPSQAWLTPGGGASVFLRHPGAKFGTLTRETADWPAPRRKAAVGGCQRAAHNAADAGGGGASACAHAAARRGGAAPCKVQPRLLQNTFSLSNPKLLIPKFFRGSLPPGPKRVHAAPWPWPSHAKGGNTWHPDPPHGKGRCQPSPAPETLKKHCSPQCWPPS